MHLSGADASRPGIEPAIAIACRGQRSTACRWSAGVRSRPRAPRSWPTLAATAIAARICAGLGHALRLCCAPDGTSLAAILALADQTEREVALRVLVLR